MEIRALYPRDMDQVKAIHEKFYQAEFSIEEFNTKYLSSFAVFNNDQLITAGGVRSLAEVVIVTDKDASVRERRYALHQVLNASKFTAARTGHSSIHAFIQDEGWLGHLLKAGFTPTKGKSLVMGI